MSLDFQYYQELCRLNHRAAWWWLVGDRLYFLGQQFAFLAVTGAMFLVVLGLMGLGWDWLVVATIAFLGGVAVCVVGSSLKEYVYTLAERDGIVFVDAYHRGAEPQAADSEPGGAADRGREIGFWEFVAEHVHATDEQGLRPRGTAIDTSVLSSFSPEDTVVIEGYSCVLFVRICGALCFLVINPLFVYAWIDDPKFAKGAVDFSDVFLAIITAVMLLLGICGLMLNFAKTRVYADAIEWGIFRRSRLSLDEIQYVDSVVFLTVNFFNAGCILYLVSKDSKKLEIGGGTEELCQYFLWLQSKYPK